MYPNSLSYHFRMWLMSVLTTVFILLGIAAIQPGEMSIADVIANLKAGMAEKHDVEYSEIDKDVKITSGESAPAPLGTLTRDIESRWPGNDVFHGLEIDGYTHLMYANKPKIFGPDESIEF